jgi:PPOX class probable F420-dependent enzyme
VLDATTEAGGCAERRLREEQTIWMMTVRSDGQPQSVPVWFLWDGEKFLVYSQPGRQKLRNTERNPGSASTSTPTPRVATWCA